MEIEFVYHNPWNSLLSVVIANDSYFSYAINSEIHRKAHKQNSEN